MEHNRGDHGGNHGRKTTMNNKGSQYTKYAIRGFFGLGLLLGSATVHAEVWDYLSLTLTGVTQYDFRGISQSGTDPAFQGSVDFKHDSGFYAQAWWSSSLDFGGCCDESWEIAYFGGFKSTFGETGLGYDVGLVYFDYPGLDIDLDYLEFYAGLSYEFLAVKAWYTENFHSIDESAFYIEGKATFELPYELSLGLHVAYTGGRALDDEFVQFTNAEQYVDYSISLGRAVGPVNLELKFLDTDLDGDLKVNDGPGANDGRVIFTVSTTLPWRR